MNAEHPIQALLPRQYQSEEVAAWLTEQKRQAEAIGDIPYAATLNRVIAEWEADFPIQAQMSEAAQPPARRPAWLRYLCVVLIWIALVWGAEFALKHGIDQRAVAAGLVLGAMASHALAFVVGVVTLVPIIGPLLVKILSIPIIWLLNSIGYLVSAVAIRRGYSKDVLTYRGLTVALITGIVLGYIFGKII